MLVPFIGSLPLIILIVLIGAVIFLSRREPSTHQRHREGGQNHSYLYYRDRTGSLRYEEDGCRDCLEARAEQLHRQGLEVTECVLGTKRSSDL